MLNFLKRLFRKKQPVRVWPVADPKNVKYTPKETPIENIIAIIAAICFALALGSCSPKGTLNCGSKYKLIAPKFNK